MSKYRLFLAFLLLGGILLNSTVVGAQDTGRWTTGAPMLSERSEVAVAEMGGSIFAVGGFGDKLTVLETCPKPTFIAKTRRSLAQ